MPTNRQRNDLLRTLVRQWAGTEPAAHAWTPAEIEQVWPALAAQRVEATLGAFLPRKLLNAGQTAAIATSRERTAFLLMELERILPTVRAADCEPLLLKGGGLALSVYKDPQSRWFVDLDLLVPPDRVAAVCAGLETVGYRPFRGRADWAYYDHHHLHRILIGPAGSVVEIHWALTLPSSAYSYDADGVRARARSVPLGRGTCLVAAPADQVIHAVYQHIADGFVDLRRVLDLVRLVPKMQPRDWREVAELAAGNDLERALAFWLHVMKQITGVTLPELPPPRRPLGPLAWRLLNNLDVPNGCLERRGTRVSAYDQFIHLVLLPSLSLRLRDLGRLAVCSRAYSLQTEHRFDGVTSLPRRLRLGAWNLRQLFRVTLAGLGAISLESS